MENIELRPTLTACCRAGFYDSSA